MPLGTFKVLVVAGVLALGVGWATFDHAIASRGAMARTVVETAGYDEPQFKAKASSGPKPPSCPWWLPRCW